MATITKVEQFNDHKSSTDFFIVHNGNMETFVVDSDWGYVELFSSHEKAAEHINEELKKPFADKNENLYILKVNNLYGIFDDNMDCTVESSDIYPILAHIRENDIPRDKFAVFYFGDDDSSESEDDDYYDNDEWYDTPPSYYDPRYDGPMHYIPPGNH